MRSLDLRGKQSKNGKYHSYKGTVGKVSYDPPHRDFHVDKPFEKLISEGGARDQTIESTITNYKIPVIIRRTKVIIISEPGGNVKALITDRIRPAEYHREAILSII